MGKVNNKIDESFSKNGLYARACCFFNKHSKEVYIDAGVIFVLIFTFVCGWVYSSFRLARMQRDYVNLTDEASKISFVKNIRGSP
jgi:hypothetical protein